MDTEAAPWRNRSTSSPFPSPGKTKKRTRRRRRKPQPPLSYLVRTSHIAAVQRNAQRKADAETLAKLRSSTAKRVIGQYLAATKLPVDPISREIDRLKWKVSLVPEVDGALREMSARLSKPGVKVYPQDIIRAATAHYLDVLSTMPAADLTIGP